jgi:hypothetical protein
MDNETIVRLVSGMIFVMLLVTLIQRRRRRFALAYRCRIPLPRGRGSVNSLFY